MVIRFCFFSEHRKKWDKHGSPSYRSQMTGLSLTWRTSNQNHGTIEDTANWEKKRNAFYVQNDNKIQYFCSSASPPRSSTLGRIQVAKHHRRTGTEKDSGGAAYLGERAPRRQSRWRWWAARRTGPARAPRTPPAAATSPAAPLLCFLPLSLSLLSVRSVRRTRTNQRRRVQLFTSLYI